MKTKIRTVAIALILLLILLGAYKLLIADRVNDNQNDISSEVDFKIQNNHLDSGILKSLRDYEGNITADVVQDGIENFLRIDGEEFRNIKNIIDLNWGINSKVIYYSTFEINKENSVVSTGKVFAYNLETKEITEMYDLGYGELFSFQSNDEFIAFFKKSSLQIGIIDIETKQITTKELSGLNITLDEEEAHDIEELGASIDSIGNETFILKIFAHDEDEQDQFYRINIETLELV